MLVLVVAVLSVALRSVQAADNEPGAQLASAQSLLVRYLEDFAAGSYAKVVRSVSDGTWSQLQEWNPSIAAGDSLGLLEAGCSNNGLMCLRVLRVESGEQVGDGAFRFHVSFVNSDGTQFVRGPCCGSSIEYDPPDSVFTYTVHIGKGRDLVQEMPPYVP